MICPECETGEVLLEKGSPTINNLRTGNYDPGCDPILYCSDCEWEDTGMDDPAWEYYQDELEELQNGY